MIESIGTLPDIDVITTTLAEDEATDGEILATLRQSGEDVEGLRIVESLTVVPAAAEKTSLFSGLGKRLQILADRLTRYLPCGKKPDSRLSF